MKSIGKHPENSFIKMASLKMDFYHTLKFLSNWKTMFWVIRQEQHTMKTLEFTESNSYFYNSFTYEKNI